MEGKLIKVFFTFENGRAPTSSFYISEEHYQAILWELKENCCNYETEELSGVFVITFKEDVDAHHKLSLELSLIVSIQVKDIIDIRDLLKRYRLRK